MILLPPGSTRTDPLFPYPTLFRSIAQQTDHLHQLHIERHLVMGQRPDRRLDTFYRAGVIGAPYVDKLIRALRLLVMIGQIRAEIGPASVRFLDRTVLIVASLGSRQIVVMGKSVSVRVDSGVHCIITNKKHNY